MEALTSCSSKLLALSSSTTSSKSLLKKPEMIRFFPPQKPSSSSSLSLQFKPIDCISPSPLSSQLQADVSTGDALTELVETEEVVTENQTAEEAETGTTRGVVESTKTVHVRFQLRKQCYYGQQFLVVGDHPIFGLWDPENAVPLNWTEGHLWTAEMDLPVGKMIQFKFILKGDKADIAWQPGPDRIFRTWETENTIVVQEDWDTADFQLIQEEAMVPPVNNAVVDVQEKPIENNKSILTEDGVTPAEQSDTNSIVAEETSDSNEELAKRERAIVENAFGSNGVPKTESEDEPVLVPGLATMPPMTTEEVLIKEIEARNVVVAASAGADESEGNSMPKSGQNQKHEKQEINGSTHQEKSIVAVSDNDGSKEEQVFGLEERPYLVEEERPLYQTEILEERPHLIEEEKPDGQTAVENAMEPHSSKEEKHDCQTAVENVMEPHLIEEEKPDGQTAVENAMEPHSSKEEQPDCQTAVENVMEPHLIEEEKPDSQTAVENAMENDIQWGRNTMQKLLEMLGFPSRQG